MTTSRVRGLAKRFPGVRLPRSLTRCLMTTLPARTLSPIVRDRPGPVQPIHGAIAAITGQPLTAVGRMLGQCTDALKGLAGVRGDVTPEDACHTALKRFGYKPHQVYADLR